jgi:hypothetical protein
MHGDDQNKGRSVLHVIEQAFGDFVVKVNSSRASHRSVAEPLDQLLRGGVVRLLDPAWDGPAFQPRSDLCGTL